MTTKPKAKPKSPAEHAARAAERIRAKERAAIVAWLGRVGRNMERLADKHAFGHGEEAGGTTALRFESEIRAQLAGQIERGAHLTDYEQQPSETTENEATVAHIVGRIEPNPIDLDAGIKVNREQWEQWGRRQFAREAAPHVGVFRRWLGKVSAPDEIYDAVDILNELVGRWTESGEGVVLGNATRGDREMSEPRIPAEVFPPGGFILEEMEHRRIDRDEVCRVSGMERETLDAILDDGARIDGRAALHLERAFGVSSACFINLDLAYRRSHS